MGKEEKGKLRERQRVFSIQNLLVVQSYSRTVSLSFQFTSIPKGVLLYNDFL